MKCTQQSVLVNSTKLRYLNSLNKYFWAVNFGCRRTVDGGCNFMQWSFFAGELWCNNLYGSALFLWVLMFYLKHILIIVKPKVIKNNMSNVSKNSVKGARACASNSPTPSFRHHLLLFLEDIGLGQTHPIPLHPAHHHYLHPAALCL